MPHFPPPPQLPPKVGLFQRVPPAVFPAVLGLLGVGIAWRRGVDVLGVPGELVEMYLGMVSLLLVYCLLAYAVKAVRRPGAVAEDFATLPGRTGIAALTMCLMVWAAVMFPYGAALAWGVFVLGLVGWAIGALVVALKRIKGADTTGPMTPAMYLVFVGVIVAPAAAVPLGVSLPVVALIVWYSLFATVGLSLLTLPALIRGTVPEAMRPIQCIHLAPVSLVASGAFLSGQPVLGGIAAIWASVVALLLIWRARWMTVAGFSGFWSAFTFPVSSYSGALLITGKVMALSWVGMLGGVVLVFATLTTIAIAFRVMKLWAKGALAAKTNASIA